MTDPSATTIRSQRAALERLKQLGFSPKTVIDVGVAWGTPCIYETYPHAYYHLIEPLNVFRETIADILSQYKGEAHFVAAGENAEQVTIAVAPTTLGYAGASLFNTTHDKKPVPESQSKAHNEDSRKYFTFDVKPLDAIIAAETIKTPCLIKIDAQGFDLAIAKSGPRVLEKCDIAILETTIFPFQNQTELKDKNLIANVIPFMESQGFSVYDIVDPLYRDHDDALGQIDLIFARNNSPLRTHKGW